MTRDGSAANGRPLRVHVLQHVAFEWLGSIQPWLQARDAVISVTRFFESPVLPDLGAVDAVIALGGPMSVNDEHRHPWLRAEKHFVAAAMEAGLPVLGICLGAQLMAAARGAAVYPAPHREIGWLPVHACDRAGDVFPFPPAAEVFQWHGETFDLPPGARLLARSEACPHQAFQIGRRAVALQFHLETTPAGVDALVSQCRDELVPGKYVQDEAALLAAQPQRYAAVNRLMDDVLAYIMGPAAAGRTGD